MSQQPTQQQLVESNIRKLVQALCSSSPQDNLKAKEYLRRHADLIPRVIQGLQYLNRDKEVSYLQREFGGLPLFRPMPMHVPLRPPFQLPLLPPPQSLLLNHPLLHPLPTNLCVYFLSPPRGICVPIFISILFSVKLWHDGVSLMMRRHHTTKMYLPIHVDNNILSPPHPIPGLLSLPPLFPLSRFNTIYLVSNPQNRFSSSSQYAVTAEKIMFENASSMVSPEFWAWSL